MFKYRSHSKELLDADNIPAKDLFQNLKELDIINTLLGGYKISLSALNTVIKNNNPCTFVDIGCGGGDTLKYIFNWNKRAKKNISFIGIDNKPVCISYAKTNTAALPIRYICDDYKCLYEYESNVGIIHASLFCHHLTEEQLVELVAFALKHKATLIINDLERNPIAYYSIKLLTYLFSKSYLVKNDAPLSVSRGFKKKEWIEILTKAGAADFSIKNKWAFRHQIIVYGNTFE